jgi:hypothetical protein
MEIKIMRRRGIGGPGPGVGRRPGPSLIGVAATTAVVAGTAGAVSHHQDQKYAKKEAASQQQQMAMQPAQPSVDTMTDEKYTQLQKLGELKQAGVLSEEEFAVEKAKILAS